MNLESIWKEIEELQHRLDGLVRKLENLEHSSDKTPLSLNSVATSEKDLDSQQQNDDRGVLSSDAAARNFVASEEEVLLQQSQEMGMKWLVVVGVIALIMALGFGVRLALARGLIDEPTRCGLVALFGVVLFGTGSRLRANNPRYGEVLMGGGIVGVMIGIYAAHHLYQLLAAPVALSLVALTAFASAILSWQAQAKSPIYIGMLGVYLAPFLVDSLGNSLGAYLAYLSLMNFSYLIVAYSIRELPLHILTLYLSTLLFSYGWYSIFREPSLQWQSAFIFQVVQALAYGLASMLPALRRKQGLSQLETWLIFPVLLLFYFYAGDLLRKHAPEWHLLFGIGVGFATISLAELGRRALGIKLKAHEASIMTVSSALLIALHMLYIHSDAVALSVGIVIWFYLLAAARAYFSKHKFLNLLAVAGLFWTVARLFFMFDYPSGAVITAFLNIQFFLIALLGLSLIFLAKKKIDDDSDIDWLAYGGHLMILSVLSMEVGRMHFGKFEPFVITLLWMFYAALISAYGFIRHHSALRKQALTIFAISAFKVFILDTSGSSMEVKAASYFALGLVLTIAGYFYQKRKRHSKAS